MPITKKSGRQAPIQAFIDIAFGDITSGVAAAAIELPPGAVVIGGAVNVGTAFNSATSDVINVGDAGSANRYLNGGNIHATGRVPLVPTGYVTTAPTNVTVTWTGVGAAPSAGAITLELQYYVRNRAQFAQGLDA